ncbi:MAG: SCP2 sterol-binding domain-containing protein [Methylococcales bacterium]|nr:SCP2 sterol-binding domain-containing protein [Methylococcales bacterium]
MLIKPLLSGAFEKALNQYFSLDHNNTSLSLAPLAGKVISITVKPFNETLYLCPTDKNIQCLEMYVGDVDATLTGYPSAFGLLGFPNLPLPDTASDKIEITGNQAIGEQFKQLFKQHEFNIEEKIASITGAEIAGTLTALFQSGQAWKKETIETFKLNVTEFLQEETRDVPALAEADIVYKQIMQLNQSVDAIEKRIIHLQNTE